MRNPSFGVVTFVVTALVVVGVTARQLRRFIPAVSENAMGREKEPFLLAGRLQSIPWQRLTPDAFAEARRTGKPVLVLIGLVTSRTARQIDDALQDPDVARLVSRRFVCVRVDGLEHPEWINAFLPVSRLRLGFQPDAQVWVLDAEGRPFFFIGRLSNDTPFHGNAMLSSFQEALTKFGQLQSRDGEGVGALQLQDQARLAGHPPGMGIDPIAYLQTVHDSVDRQFGGFPVAGVRRPMPYAHRYLLTLGDLVAAREAMDGLLNSPLRDVVEGGFYHTALGTDPWYVEFDKWTVETADMAPVLAVAYRLLGDPKYRDAAIGCLNALERSLMGKRYLTAGEVGYTYGRDRSPRHSFPPRRLAEILTPDEAAWAQSNLNLDLAANPQAVPYPSPTVTLSETDPIRRKLFSTAPPAQFAPEGYADVHLSGLARAIQTARLLGDAHRLRVFSRRLDETWSFFMTGRGQVCHRAEAEEEAVGLLGDHLALADAKLQDYLATGHYVSFEDGLRVLRQALASFRRESGVYRVTTASPGGLPPAAFPEIADNLRESTTAQAIRLLLGYGRLLEDRPEGKMFLQEARAAVGRYSLTAYEGGLRTAAFFGSAAEALDPAYAVCTGPNAQRLADDLARACPARLVTPAFGDVRRDLSSRGPGIYIIRETAQGPLTFEQATRLLSSTLEMPK